jgi:GT2 family glycosyltransferase
VWIDREKLAAQVAYLGAQPTCAVVGSFISLIDEAGHEIGSNRYACDDRSIRSNLLWRNQFAHSSVLMRTDLVSAVGGYRPRRYGEDLDLYLRLGKIGTFGNLPRVTTAYRLHASGVSHGRFHIAQAAITVISEYRQDYPGYWIGVLKMSVLALYWRLRYWLEKR